MKYEGKLYAKYAGKFIELIETGKEFDDLKKQCFDRANRVIELASENELLKEAMREFVERVDKGEVKSKYTYNKFKRLLKP